jgi:hypothetical protein
LDEIVATSNKPPHTIRLARQSVPHHVAASCARNVDNLARARLCFLRPVGRLFLVARMEKGIIFLRRFEMVFSCLARCASLLIVPPRRRFKKLSDSLTIPEALEFCSQ